MVVERQNNEIIIRVPENIDMNVLQNFIDYLKVQSIVTKSKANEEDVEKISREVNSSWWNKNKNKFIK